VGGPLIVISYHSGEDRIVKRFNEHRKHEEDGRILFKKPITPTIREIAENARARSAKLRALEKVSR
jgi:16S rRNA (cytosine1402-N4)-methyltransferase